MTIKIFNNSLSGHLPIRMAHVPGAGVGSRVPFCCLHKPYAWILGRSGDLQEGANLVVGDPSGTWGSGYLNIMQLARLFWLIQSEHQSPFSDLMTIVSEGAHRVLGTWSILHCTQPPNMNPFSRNMLTWAKTFFK